jgi:hypothetical protein
VTCTTLQLVIRLEEQTDHRNLGMRFQGLPIKRLTLKLVWDVSLPLEARSASRPVRAGSEGGGKVEIQRVEGV